MRRATAGAGVLALVRMVGAALVALGVFGVALAALVMGCGAGVGDLDRDERGESERRRQLLLSAIWSSPGNATDLLRTEGSAEADCGSCRAETPAGFMS